jgi:hypothetical protein
MSLMTEFREIVRGDAADALETYRSILARRHAPGPNDAEALRDCAVTLGVTPAGVEADARALDEAEALARRVLSPAEATERRAAHDAAVTAILHELRGLFADALAGLTDDQFQRAIGAVHQALFTVLFPSDAATALDDRWKEIGARYVAAGEAYRTALVSSGQAAAQLAELRRAHREAFVPADEP